MVEKKRVAVYGSSLYMAGIAASLRADQGLKVLRILPGGPDDLRLLEEFAPEAIAFDVGEPVPGPVLAVLSKTPGLLLIGVDPAGDKMLLLSGRNGEALCVADLVRVIREDFPEGNGPPVEEARGEGARDFD